MKKFMGLMLGAALVIGSATMVFAADDTKGTSTTDKKDKKDKKKKDKKKKTDDSTNKGTSK
jgi:hypothetical protein